jgi:release factor glutamine methyltransferase|nr:peptide chain release factor N(5)-glutamine methyltransferase [Kofleriaceae bacterium]
MTQTWTTLGVLDWTTKRFGERNISSARLEAQVLLAHVLACTRVQLYTAFDKPLAEAELASFRELIRRRLAGEPLAYLVGETEFWSLPFYVDPSVLVPRPDSETVIEVAVKLRGTSGERRTGSSAEGDAEVDAKAAACRVLDLCTGSGILAISLARELPAARVIATELSPEAAAVARRNADRNAVADRVDVRVGDLFAPVAGEPPFDLIVGNPPYIATATIATLSAEVHREPALALDGGGDGLAFYDRIAAAARDHLAPGGAIVLEHGFDQADAVRKRLTDAGLVDVELTCDLARNPRVTSARRAP